MKIKKLLLFISYFVVYSNNLSAKTVIPEESKNLIQEQEAETLVPAYIWPLYVSPLTLAQKDLFFTVARLVEDEITPGHFTIKPLFAVPTITIKIPEALYEYFTFKIPILNPKELLAGLKQIELPTIEQQYVIPVKEFNDLVTLKQQFSDATAIILVRQFSELEKSKQEFPEKQFPKNSVIIFGIPEDKQELESTQQKLKEENIDLDQATFDLLSSLSDFNNYISIEELKDYIRKFPTYQRIETSIETNEISPYQLPEV